MLDDITAVMIVRNEEAVLSRCLDSLKGVMPVVLADTGSTDRTMEIAREYGAEVHEHPWQDSFSEARNWITEKVQTKWALQIDADEEIVQSTIPALDDLQENVSAYLTPIRNPREDGSASFHYFERIIQPKKIRYKWRVHNEVVVKEGETEKRGLAFLHHGYAKSEEEMDRKFQDTLRLLMLDIDDAGYVLRNVRYLVQTLSGLREWERVIELVREHGHVVEKSHVIFQMVHTSLMVAYSAVGDPDSAIKTGIAVIKKYPRCIDALFNLAVIYEDREQWSDAVECYLSYVSWRRSLQGLQTAELITYTTWGSLIAAFTHLAICLDKIGRQEEALIAFARADRLGMGRTDEEALIGNTDQLAAMVISKRIYKASGAFTSGGWDAAISKR